MAPSTSAAAAPSLGVSVGNLSLKNPVLTASGTFGYGQEFAPYTDLASLGGIIVKGLSLTPMAGNPMPRLAETPCGMLNAIGLQNIGVEAFLNDKLPKLPHQEVPIIANLYACDPEEFGKLAGMLAKAEGIAAIEVNVSCPNVTSGGVLFGQDPAQAAKVTESVKAQAGDTPVWVKLAPLVTDIAAIAKAVEAAGADALCCINTIPGMTVDLQRRTPRLANGIGGLSGPAIKPIALRCVWQVAKAVSIPVVGVGGISTAEDVLEFILAGATAVQIGTANFMRPDTSQRIVEALPETMTKWRVESLEGLRGSLKM